jgi:hypothetical protein
MRRRLTCAAQRRRRAPHAARTALCGNAAAMIGRAPRGLPGLVHPGSFDCAPGRVGGQERDELTRLVEPRGVGKDGTKEDAGGPHGSRDSAAQSLSSVTSLLIVGPHKKQSPPH